MADVTVPTLHDRVALVAGATRGAGRGCALALAAAGAYVYCTGRSRAGQPGGMERPETIDETVALIEAAGGQGQAVCVDHTQPEAVAALADQVRAQHGQLDVLVNSIWGADPSIEWGKRFWEIDVRGAAGYLEQTLISHIISNRYLTPLLLEAEQGLLVELVDGAFDGYRGQLLYDQTKAALMRLAYSMALELVDKNLTALALSPGFLRSEAVLEHFSVAEQNWRDAIEQDAFFAESETPQLVGRAVVALATDPHLKQKAGLTLIAADLAREYGFTDVDGRQPDFLALLDARVRELAEAATLHGDGLDAEGQFLVWARYCQIHRDPGQHALAQHLADALSLSGLGPGIAPAGSSS